MRIMMKLTAVWLVFGLFFGAGLFGQQRYTLKSPEFRIEVDEDGFHRILVKGYSSYGVAGYPDLPSRLYRIAVPPEAIPASISVSYGVEEMGTPGFLNIAEIPPMTAWVDDRYVYGEKEDVYTQNDFFPRKPLEYAGVSRMRKWKIVTLKYTPFQFNPVTGETRSFPEIEVSIDYQKIERDNEMDAGLTDSVMDDRAARMIDNYDQAAGWYSPRKKHDQPMAGYDYVIITTNAIESSSTKLDGFVNYLTGIGFSPLVVTEDEFGGLTGPAPNGTAEKIRQWLINNYVSYGINYVLLIGDPDPDDPGDGGDSVGDIPMKMCWPRRNIDSYEEAPTDYFYADLTGNWDLDGDQYYGEWEDFTGNGGVDFLNEVYVGRIPVYSGAAQLDSILTKTVDYGTASNISWRKSALLPMSFSTEYYDGAPLAEQMKDDYLISAGFTVWTQYQQGSGPCGLDSSYSSSQELRGGTIVRDRWAANDYGLVLWWGHGSSTSAVVGCSGCWDGTLMASSYASYLDDGHPSFVYLNSCLNGYPESSGNLQYSLLENGAIGTVGATRVSWFNTGVGYGGFDGSTTNSGIGYEFADRIAAGQTAAEALYNAKSSMNPSMKTRLMNFYDFNLYGDPATSLAASYIPEINVKAKGITFLDGSLNDFGTKPLSLFLGLEVRFKIENLGTSFLSLTGSPDRVYLSGPDAGFFRVTKQPGSPVSASGYTVFKVKTTKNTAPPLPDGWKKTISFDINIPNDDADENPYNFTIKVRLKK